VWYKFTSVLVQPFTSVCSWPKTRAEGFSETVLNLYQTYDVMLNMTVSSWSRLGEPQDRQINAVMAFNLDFSGGLTTPLLLN
jgi:hypothetical protein